MQTSREDLQRAVERWRRLIVPHWNVVLKDDPPPDVAPEDRGRGYCQTNPDLQSVKVSLNASEIEDQRDLDETIVHELLHAAFDEVLDPLKSQLTELAPQTASAVRRQVTSTSEPLIERLARVITAFGHEASVYRTEWDATESR